MKRVEHVNDKTLGVRLTALANWVVRIVGAGIFFILTWYAFRYTQYMNPQGAENPVNVQDSMTKNIVFLILAMAVIAGLYVSEKYLNEKIQQWLIRISLILVSVWVGCFGLWWITVVDRLPVGDQAFVYGGASYFIEGEYSFLEATGYCGIYPHQLGLIFLTEILFCFVGTYNYFAFQFICVELAVGIVILGHVLVREMTEHMSVAVTYCLLMAFCLPLVFYTGWVYGEIPSIFFALLTTICLLRYEKTGKNVWLAGMVLAVLMALLVRKNSLIMLVALCLVAGVYVLKNKDKKLFVALLVSVILPIIAYQGIYKMYEVRSGIPHEDGLPTVTFVAMGLQENEGKCGWYNNYGKEIYYQQECDTELTTVVAKQDIQSRLKEWKENPSYAVTFFREKILSQWNEPLYQAMFFSTQYMEGKEPEQGSFVHKLGTEYFLKVLAVCDRMQFILYFGMLCYYIFAVKKNSNILRHMLAVTMIGGFFFSIMWEAKARYIFPYYVMMYPLAAVGYWQAIAQVKALLNRKRKREDNIIPFERVA